MSESYYGRFYGLDSPPFHITPDSSFLFPTETHQQALGAIEYAIASGKGFVVITGEVGVGKTTVLRMCLNKLDSQKIKIIYIFNPALSIPELYSTILEELDAPHDPSHKPAGVLRLLLRALLVTHKAGIQVILAVDEAQNMPEATLEGLRILSNIETAKAKLIQIILVGQPELDTKLAKHSLRQLAQRVAVRASLRPLTIRQSRRYILHRLQCAGRTGPLFSEPALLYIAATSRGIARAINITCDNALINGYGYGAKRISLRIVRESLRSLRYRSTFGRVRFLSAATVAMITIGIFTQAPMKFKHSTVSLRKTSEYFHIDRTHDARTEVITAAVPNPINVVSNIPAKTKDDIAALSSASIELANAGIDEAAGNRRVTVDTIETHDPKSPNQTQTPDLSKDPAAQTKESDTVSLATHDLVPTDASDQTKLQPTWKWLVRRGDSVYKACMLTYGECDTQALRTILAYNPKIGTNGLIQEGMILVMPERVDLARSH